MKKIVISDDLQDKIETVTTVLVGAAAIAYGVNTISGMIYRNNMLDEFDEMLYAPQDEDEKADAE